MGQIESTKPGDRSDTLDNSVDAAIAASVKEIRGLERRVDGALAALRTAAREAELAGAALGRSGTGESAEASGAFAEVLRGARDEIDDHLTRHRDVLSTFNIALFGRTGAGKSSVLSALAELDGCRVSHGESDWTVDVVPVPWNSCLLYDTPGINGWGRTRSRDELELAARRAVEVADVVLLCFDSQSQQATEFTKVAAWVQEFSKPTIAVLNCRNLLWRHPARVSSSAARQNLSRAVSQHATNIRDSLWALGMTATPVVAVHARHALDSRAAQPYRGPDESNHHRRRQDYGVDYLYRWSNLGTLQELIAALVQAGGKTLRVHALREGVRATLGSWAERLVAEATSAQGALDVLDLSIDEALTVLGYPISRSRKRHWLRSSSGKVDPLGQVESLRGAHFTAPTIGRFERTASQIVSNEFGPLRTKSLRSAGRCVRTAFDRRRPLDDRTFTKAVFDEKGIKAAATRAERRAAQFLERELGMTFAEASSDLEFEARAVRADGAAGATAKLVGTGLRIGELVGGAVGAALAIIATTNFWNPVGWVAAAILGGIGIVSGVLGWFGRRTQKSAERKRLQARDQALGEARLAVGAAYDAIEDRVRSFLLAASRKAYAPVLVGMLGDWLSIRRSQDAMFDAAGTVRETAKGIPRSNPPRSVLLRATAAVLNRHGKSEQADSVLLGEDWITAGVEPHTVVATAGAELTARMTADAKRLTEALARLFTSVPTDRVHEWIADIASIGDDDGRFAEIASPAPATSDPAPAIVMIGDYNAGKTTLIKRLIAETGKTPPPSLKVAGLPTTSQSDAFAWKHLSLVDSPGLQSGNLDHDIQPATIASGSALIIVVLNVNLLIGDSSRLREILEGTNTVTAKLRRTFFVINRADEFGVDPTGDPVEFQRRRDRKEAELRDILAAHGLVGGFVVHTVAADPYGLVGDRPVHNAAAYDIGAREWDGITPLVSALASTEEHVAELRACAAMDAALDALLAYRTRMQREMDEIAALAKREHRFLATVDEATEAGALLRSALIADARASVQAHAERAAAEALTADAERLAFAAQRASTWWDSPIVRADAVQYWTKAARSIRDWQRDTQSMLDRAAPWTAPANIGKVEHNSRAPSADNGNVAAPTRLALTAGNTIAKVGGQRDAYYAIGKFFNYKFKPWGAVKGAAKIAKVGAVIAVVGVVFDAGMFVKDIAAEGRRESARKDITDFINDTIDKVTESLTDGDDDETPGPVTFVDDDIRRLREARDKSQSVADEFAARHEALASRVAALEAHLSAAPVVFTEEDGDA